MAFLIWLIIVIAIIVMSLKKAKIQQQQAARRPGGQPVAGQSMQQNLGQPLQMGYGRPQPAQNYGQQQTTGRPRPTQEDIMSKARQNVAAYSSDVTMQELEESHGHSAKVSSTGTLEFRQQQKEAHPHDAAHVSAELDASAAEILGQVEELMVKGYEAKLPYERDFLGEGMDMISRFIYE